VVLTNAEKQAAWRQRRTARLQQALNLIEGLKAMGVENNDVELALKAAEAAQAIRDLMPANNSR